MRGATRRCLMTDPTAKITSASPTPNVNGCIGFVTNCVKKYHQRHITTANSRAANTEAYTRYFSRSTLFACPSHSALVMFHSRSCVIASDFESFECASR